MILDALFFLVFLSQVVTLSFYLPRALARQLAGSSPAPRANAEGGRTRVDEELGRYSSANTLLIPLGLVLLALFFTLDVFESLTATLLAIGLFFFLQLSPLALVRGQLALRRELEAAPWDAEAPPPTIRLFDLVSPAAVGIAGALLVAYAATQLALSGGAWGPQTLKVLILTGANAFIAGLVAWNLHRFRGQRGETRARRFHELVRVAPMLVYISIGLSVYFFGKDVIFSVGVPRLRLIMMSLALQMLGGLAFTRMIVREGQVNGA